MTEPRIGQVAYRPGRGTALVAGHCLVLLGSEVSRSAATELWPEVERADSFVALVEAVLNIGLRNLPTIAIAYRGDGECQVLLRGSARGAVGSTYEEAEALLASDARTWKEHAVSGPLQLFLDDRPGDDVLPLTSGVVPADALIIDGPLVTEDVPEPAKTDLPAPSQGVVVTPSFIDRDESASPIRHDRPPEPDDSPDMTLLEPPSEDGSGADLPTPDPASLPSPPAPPVEHGLPDVLDSRPMASDVDEDSFDDLFGETGMPVPIERAAVRPLASEGEDPPPGPIASSTPERQVSPGPPAAGLGSGGFAPPRVSGPAGPTIPAPPAGDGGLIEGIPGVGTSHAAPPVPAEVPSAVPSPLSPPVPGITAAVEDDPQMTVSRSSLASKRRQAQPKAAIDGPTVHGVWCPEGHPNPPTASTCRSCGQVLSQADPVTMARPVLGVLRFSNGIEVELDRSVIIGRAPKAERVSARELPQLVTLPSPDKDISRNHLEVKLDGWHVIVVDMGSTNGTVVTLPGQPPLLLRASEEQPISPGSVVTVAEEITFVYEVPA